MIIKCKQHHQLPNKEGTKEMTYANVFGLEAWKWAAVRRAACLTHIFVQLTVKVKTLT
jgi:hypothetical protein